MVKTKAGIPLRGSAGSRRSVGTLRATTRCRGIVNIATPISIDATPTQSSSQPSFALIVGSLDGDLSSLSAEIWAAAGW